MRRKDREMPEEFGLEVIDECRYGVAAMTDTQGEPYAVALNLVRDGRTLYFHCAAEGKKVEALRRDPRLCISFVGSDQPLTDKFTTLFESAIVRGRASLVEDEAEKIHALRLLCEKLTPANMPAFDKAIERSLNRTAVWRVYMEEITAKRKN
ncbi:MAG: pyridoxamine 5'-phosphate oxidase family protein [Oscillospiraceae bacterium]|nr:pyridoxamine 5'-phosphate oxidase family protein [Oscillospiraceae bacterium]